MPDRDLTFIKEDLSAPAVRAWAGRGREWVAVDDTDQGPITGFVAIAQLPGWSDHVGEIRLVVHPERRGAGIGTELARHALTRAVRMGLAKVVVEVVADQDALLAMFTGLGFTGEALLCNQIRDRTGAFRDLVVLAHYVDDTWAAMQTFGLDHELADPTEGA